MKRKQSRRLKGTGSIFRTARGVYTLRYHDVNGDRKQVSLGTKNEREATVKAAELEKVLKAQGQAEAMFQIAQARDNIDIKPLPFKEVWQAFMGTSPTAGPGTLKLYERVLNEFIEWMMLNRFSIRNFTEIDFQTANSYTEHVWEQGVSASTYNDKRNALGHITKRFTNKYNIIENPWPRTERKKGVQQKRLPLSRQQALKLMKVMEEKELPYGIELRCVVLLGLYAGMRLGDAVQLKKSCVDLNNGKIEYTPSKTAGTSGKIVELPILEPLAIELANLSGADNDLLLPDVASHYDRNPDYIKEKVKMLIHSVTGSGEQDGKSQKLRSRSLYGFHSLRHTFATEAARAGVSALHLSLMTGDTIQTLQKYYVKIGLRQTPVSGFERMNRLLSSGNTSSSPEREEMHRLADALPIKKVRELLAMAKAKEIEIPVYGKLEITQ